MILPLDLPVFDPLFGICGRPVDDVILYYGDLMAMATGFEKMETSPPADAMWYFSMFILPVNQHSYDVPCIDEFTCKHCNCQ